MKTKELVPMLMAGFLALPAAATAEKSKTAAADIPKLKFEKYQLSNGLEVILSEDHRLPLVAVNLWYHVGPANEEPGRTGFAHLFEHMMFQGSKHVEGDSHIKLLEAAGASELNGTTGFDRTNYFQTLPSNQLELALWLESDRMGFLLDALNQAKLANQQDVVRNERREGVENQPYGIVEEEMFHQLYPSSHPYYASVIGSHADIQAAQLEDVKKFFKLYYAPNNASLAIVGDIDFVKTKKLVEKYFGSFKRGADVPKPNVTTPPITSERRATVQDRIELPRVYLAWITPSIFKEGDAEGGVAAQILGSGKSSRLFKKLVYEKQIAQDVLAEQYALILGSIFYLQVTARPGHSAEEIETAINEELETLRTKGPTEAEVERAKNVIESGIIRGLETLGGFGGVADRLNMYNHYLGSPDYLTQDITRYRRTTPASVQKFAQRYLKNEARVVVHGVAGTPNLGPEVPTPQLDSAQLLSGAESVNLAEPWRSEIPKPASERALKLPVPESFKLSNGLTVIYNHRPWLPITSARLVIKTGSDANPKDLPGLANFTVGMLDEGTKTRNALQIADEVAGLGASLSTSSTMDASQVAVQSLTKNFSKALELLSDVVLHPSFPEEEIERQRASRLAGLVQERENPSAVASRVMARVLYGSNHPYGYPEIGTEAAIKATNQADMRALWEKNFVPNNAALVVAGSIGKSELKSLAENAFAGWKAGTPALSQLGNPATTPARVVIVDKPGAPQTQLRVTTIGTPRSTPDYAAMQVTNGVLGGLFSSRINLNLREQHGYTYGAFSAFVFRRSAGPFLVATGVRTDVTGPSVSEIFKEIKRMSGETVSADELALSRQSLVRSLPGDFETSSSAAGSFSNLYVYDLGLDWYSKFPASVSAVDAATVQATAKKYLVPEKMVVVAVGDKTTIRPELEKLNLGAVEVRDTEGTLAQQ
ncbi:MAG: insulinase family protein [candidate division Zixibacteria bacterium]|nr:insulinase family protein [candidate division Zixibacteria bacterium]